MGQLKVSWGPVNSRFYFLQLVIGLLDLEVNQIAIFPVKYIGSCVCSSGFIRLFYCGLFKLIGGAPLLLALLLLLLIVQVCVVFYVKTKSSGSNPSVVESFSDGLR